MKNILILGSGGREHAFAWKLKQSPLCGHLFIAPGNAGTEQVGQNVAISPTDFGAIKDFVLDNNIQMVVVGPEAPLVEGIYDYFQSDDSLKSIALIGPSKEGAQLEGSKDFGKRFMAKMNIPTAAYQSFKASQIQEAFDFIDQQTPPIVLKADGLAAGKGVLIIDDKEEAKAELKIMFSGKFGAAGDTVVIEQFLKGIECSVFVMTDGEHYQTLPIAKDYKRIGEGDKGLNTGGMGAVSPVIFVDEVLRRKVEERITKPTVIGLKEQGIDYKGFIFIGLIVVENEPYVIEYNCRMGDPETEVVLPRLKNDLVEMFDKLAQGRLNECEVKIDERAATTIMLVSGGYPEAYEKGKEISNVESISDSIIFHAGTKSQDGKVLTNGGRVMAITSYGADFKEALAISNKNAKMIDFEGKNYRKDIGFDL